MADTTSFWTDARAAANTVGYLIMVAIFLAGGLSLLVVSITAFTDSNQNSPVNDATEQMSELRAQFSEFADGVPYKKATLQASTGSLSYDDPVTVTVDSKVNSGYFDAGNPPPGCSADGSYCEFASQDTRPIVFDVEGGSSRYVGGMIVQQQSGGSIVKQPGTWRINDDSARFPLLGVEQEPGSSGNVGVSGEGNRFVVEGYADAVTTNRWETDSSDDPADPSNLKVRVTYENLDNPDAVKTFFQDSNAFTFQSMDAGNGEVVVTFTTDRIVVREIPIDASFR